MNLVLSMFLPVFFSLLVAQEDRSESPPPSFVLIVADDLGWRDLGVYGHPYHRTKNLDELAREGSRFTQAYANAPNCAPSRACLMTGLATPRHGIYTVGKSTRGKSEHRKLIPVENRTDLDPRFETLAERLAGAGYKTAHMGKWHLGETPLDHGFEINVAGTKAGHPKRYRSPYGNPAIEDGIDGEHLTERLGREAVSFLESMAPDRPFFLYLPYYAVHTPIQPPDDLKAKSLQLIDEGVERRGKKAAYAALVEALDLSVGEVLSALERTGRDGNTVVIFFSDNGGHGLQTDMSPLRGSKGMLYEGGIRVPLILRWPDRIKAGEVDPLPVIGTDLFPTILELAGIPFETSRVDGISLGSRLLGDSTTSSRALCWHFPAYLEGYAKKTRWRTTPASAIRMGNYKLLEFFEDGIRELYDLSLDPGEANDLGQDLPDVAEALHQELCRWREEVGAPVPRERNPDYEPETDENGSSKKTP